MKRKKQISKNPTHYPQKVRKEFHTKVNLEFEDLPLEEGLKRLFNNQNYSLFYSGIEDIKKDKSPHRLVKVFLLGNSSSNEQRFIRLPDDMMAKVMDLDAEAQVDILNAYTDQTVAATLKSDLSAIHTQLLDIQNQWEDRDEKAELDALQEFIKEIEKKILKLPWSCLQNIIQYFWRRLEKLKATVLRFANKSKRWRCES